jgi:hypothetical protein
MSLSKNQMAAVKKDISDFVRTRAKEETTPEEVFDFLAGKYTGVTLTDVKSLLEQITEANR